MTTVGVDLIEIDRVRRALERPRFRERCFTEAERAYCDSRPNPAQHYAARFAGKEAVGKALGFGVARLWAWQEIEIAGRPKPAVALSGPRRRLGREAGRRGDRPVDDPLARAGDRRLRGRWPVAILDPLFTAAEMRAAEEEYPNYPESIPRADGARRQRPSPTRSQARYPDARRITTVAGAARTAATGASQRACSPATARCASST